MLDSNSFANDVWEGLSRTPKCLPSKYFYDQAGDALFQRIMALDEYYLTRAELSIFQNQADELLRMLHSDLPFRVIELGAGDGFKTRVLLRHWTDRKIDFTYAPVDISNNVLSILEENLKDEIPELAIESMHGDYFRILADLKLKSDRRNIIFFLGSNIGNFRGNLAADFLGSIRENLRLGDMMLIGFDLKKDPNRILAAYNDREGVTRDFNLNLLHRINRELGGNFNIGTFTHHPTYNPVTGECKSYLISTVDQQVTIAALETTFSFQKWEPIFMEVSRKFDLEEINRIATQSGFSMQGHLTDTDGFFADCIWEAI